MIIAVIILVVLIILFACEKMFEQTNFYKNEYDEISKFDEFPKQASYVNTGSTFAFYGIDYASCGFEGINLALKPQCIESDFEMLKRFEQKYKKGTVVFIAISDLAFAKTNYNGTTQEAKYYRILNHNNIQHYSLMKAIQEKYLPVTKNIKNFLRRFHDAKRKNDFSITVNENDIEAVRADAFLRCKGWEKEFGLKNLQDGEQAAAFKSIFDYNIQIVADMIQWCKARDLFPILVNLPVTDAMGKFFSSNFLDEFYYSNIFKSNKENVPFIDMNKDSRLTDYLLYLDSCRLNAAGRMVVTKLLVREAERIKTNG